MDMRDGRPAAATQCPRGVHDLVHARLVYPVEDIPAIPANPNQPGLPEDHEVLGDVSLPPPQDGLHMANALLAIAQDIQDRQPDRMAEGMVEFGLSQIGIEVLSGARYHIRSSEYDSRPLKGPKTVP